MEHFEFMSPAHVAALNARFSQSNEVHSAAAKLSRDILWAMRLHDTISGRDIWWTTLYSPEKGCILGIGQPERAPDVQHAADYWALIAASKARGEGQEVEAPLTLEIGEPDFMAEIAEIYGACWTLGSTDKIEYPSPLNAAGTSTQ